LAVLGFWEPDWIAAVAATAEEIVGLVYVMGVTSFHFEFFSAEINLFLHCLLFLFVRLV